MTTSPPVDPEFDDLDTAAVRSAGGPKWDAPNCDDIADDRWMTAPVPPGVDKNATIFHYTSSLTGLIGIVRSHRLRASSATMLNDTSEIAMGIQSLDASRIAYAADPKIASTQTDFLQEVLSALRHSYRHHQVFVLSASLDGDSLTQWRAYGGAEGYAVGLRPRPSLRVASQDTKPRLRIGGLMVERWAPVIYDEGERLRWIDHLARYVMQRAPQGTESTPPGTDLRQCVQVAWQVLTLIKDPGFSAEQEVRFTHVLPEPAQGLPQPILFREGRYGLTPFVELGVAADPNAEALDLYGMPGQGNGLSAVTRLGRLPVAEVVAGPLAPRDANLAAIQTLLETAGHDVKVGVSRHPYR